MQGAFHKHLAMVEKAGAAGIEVRTAEDLNSVDALIIPGGESTVIAKLLIKNNIFSPLAERVRSGMGLFGTCAGLILMAEKAEESTQPLLGLMDITVRRNAYGRQLESFEAPLAIKGFKGKPFNGIFIRAPKVTAYSKEIEILAEFEDVPVLLKYRNLLAASFHPELSGDTRIHEMFLSMIS